MQIKKVILLIATLALSACGGESSSSGNNIGEQPTVKDNPQKPQTWLDEHNKYRKMHQVSELTWSAEIAKSAQDYANSCPSGHSNTKYGENIAYSTVIQTADDVVKRWYEEVELYNYANPKFDVKTGHFTQVVWKNTTQVGCGQVSNCKGEWKDIVVCQYSPSGNYISQFSSNVLPKK